MFPPQCWQDPLESSASFISSAVRIQLHAPLTLTLSPPDGEREFLSAFKAASPSGDRARRHQISSLSPSEREKVGVRGGSNCIVAAQ